MACRPDGHVRDARGETAWAGDRAGVAKFVQAQPDVVAEILIEQASRIPPNRASTPV